MGGMWALWLLGDFGSQEALQGHQRIGEASTLPFSDVGQPDSVPQYTRAQSV